MSSTDYLTMMMQTAPIGSRYVSCAERQPPKYGTYKVIKRARSRHYDYDEYLWNGSGWVTHGNSLSQAVEAWLETDVRRIKPD